MKNNCFSIFYVSTLRRKKQFDLLNFCPMNTLTKAHFNTILAILLFSLTFCASSANEKDVLELYQKNSFPISAKDPIVDINATASMQLIDDKIILNYVDTRSQNLVSLHLADKTKEVIPYTLEGPNAIRFNPDYFFMNTKKEIIVVNPTEIKLCEHAKSLKVKRKIVHESRVLSQFMTGIRPGLQQKTKLIFFNYDGREFKDLILLDIENFQQKEVKIPYQKEIFSGLNSEAAMSINCTLPFVTMHENTLVFSLWYSENVYEWDGSVAFKEKKFEINTSKNPPNTFLNSWEKAVLELSYTSHGPVIRAQSNNLYIAENYNGETKKAELFCLNDTGEKIFNLDVSNTQRFWVDGRLVKYLIDEDKNEINFEIWK